MISCNSGSIIEICDNVILEDNVVINVSKKSSLIIGQKTKIGNSSCINVYTSSCVKINSECSLGKRTNINSGDYSEFECGKSCLFSYDIKIRSSYGHTIVDLENNKIKEYERSVKLEDHVWIGAGVTILPKTKIGAHSIVGAASLVNKEFPDHVSIAGIPAKIIKTNVDWVMNPECTWEQYINNTIS